MTDPPMCSFANALIFFWCCVSEIFVWTDMVITSVELAVHVYASFGDPFSRSQIWNNAEVHLPVLSVSWLPSCSNRYLVTFSPLTDNREDPQAIIIWDVRTGQKKRGFHCESQTTWPIFKWVVMRGRGIALPILCNLFVSNVASWETESQTTWPVLEGMAMRGRGSALPLSWTLFASNMWDWMSNKMAYLEVCVVHKGMLLPYKLFVSDMWGW